MTVTQTLTDEWRSVKGDGQRGAARSSAREDLDSYLGQARIKPDNAAGLNANRPSPQQGPVACPQVEVSRSVGQQRIIG